jgi:CheY-like chemotaxis protein
MKAILIVDDDAASLALVEGVLVAFTAYGESWSEAEARAAGCDGFLEKPITARMLADVVRKAVDKTG